MKVTRRGFLGAAAGTGAAIFGGLRPAFGAQPRLPMGDLVILIPGIMGSVLSKDGRDVWAISGGAIANGIRTLGKSVTGLTLAGDDPERDDLGDGITATRVMPDTHLIPGFWKIDGYSRIANFINTRFELQPNQNYFEFPYDWRRDNRAAARKLARASSGWLARWRQASGNSNARLVIFAHSMGGLVARHFLEVLGGWKDTRMLVTFGTPYRGSLNALDSLSNGIKKTLGPFTLFDISGLVRSLTSTYQLLPTYRCYDPGDGNLARVGEIDGIPNVTAARARAALTFHRDIEAAVAANAKIPAYMAGRYALHPIVGNFQPTLQSGRRVGAGLQMSEQLDGDATLRGDGTVPEASARPIEVPELEARHRTVYVADIHGSLQNSDPVLIHLGGLLREGSQNTAAFRDPTLNVALMIDDLYSSKERLTIRARCEDPAEALMATVVRAGDGQQVAQAPLQRVDAQAEATLDPLPEGTYRVRISGGPKVGSASDVFLVVDA